MFLAQRRARRAIGWTLAVAFSWLALAAGSLVVPATAETAPPPGVPDQLPGPAWPYTGNPDPYEVTTEPVVITMRDGVRLQGNVSVPVGREGDGRAADGRAWPLVVLPGTFAGTTVVTDFVGERLAARGFVTVSYLQRGFGTSEGQVGGGGPVEVADASEVIDWALATYDVDADRVGLCALSYGAGVALQTAALDPRVKAVAALSGWADLAASLLRNGTRAQYTAQALLGVLVVLGEGEPNPETSQAFQDIILGQNLDRAEAYADARSVTSYMDRLNANGPAVFIGEPMNETVFPIDQMTDFWDGYTGGPKHIDLRPGDHAGPETLQQLQLLTQSWAEAFRWMEAYVSGTDTGIAEEPAVRVYPRGPAGFRPYEVGDDLDPGSTQRMYLRTVRRFGLFAGTQNVLSAQRPGAGAPQQKLQSGVNWIARPAFPLYSFWGELATGVPPGYPTRIVSPSNTRIWEGPVLTETLHYRGELTATLQVTPSASKGTVVVSAVDLSPDGGYANFITNTPVSFSGVVPGKPTTVDVRLPYNAYDIPAGRRLGIVVSTDDVSFASENPFGSSLGIGSASYVDVPLR